MGQAKQRGTKEQRVHAAFERKIREHEVAQAQRNVGLVQRPKAIAIATVLAIMANHQTKG